VKHPPLRQLLLNVAALVYRGSWCHGLDARMSAGSVFSHSPALLCLVAAPWPA